jgi:hypothetical protein
MANSKNGNNANTSRNGNANFYHSPRNGEIVNGRTYCRKYDFSRDAWYDLTRKIVNWSQDPVLSKFVPTMEKKLKDRIRKGSCTKAEAKAAIAQQKAILNRRTSTNSVPKVNIKTIKTPRVQITTPANVSVSIGEINIYNYYYKVK